jgi:hypothetical protein
MRAKMKHGKFHKEEVLAKRGKLKGIKEMEISHEGGNHMDSIRKERACCADPKGHIMKEEEA